MAEDEGDDRRRDGQAEVGRDTIVREHPSAPTEPPSGRSPFEAQPASRWGDRLPVAHLVVVGTALVGLLHWTAVLIAARSGFAPDYGVFWTASHFALRTPDLLYDAEALTAAQSVISPIELRLKPWAYPPSALFAFLPLAPVPFFLSYLLWVSGTLLALVVVARRHLGLAAAGAGLLVLTPALSLAAIQGHASLLLAPLLLAGLAGLPRRPVLAGVLFAAALCLKPQTLLLLPVALLAGRHYRAAMSTAVTGLTVLAISVAAFGHELWLDWLSALPGFLALVEEYGLLRDGVALLPVLAALSPSPLATTLIRAGLVVLGLLLVTAVFRRTDDLVPRTTAVVGGSLLCSSYALGYDLVLLAPAAVAVLLARREEIGLGTRVTAGLACQYWLGPVAPLAFVLAVCVPVLAPVSTQALRASVNQRLRRR